MTLRGRESPDDDDDDCSAPDADDDKGHVTARPEIKVGSVAHLGPAVLPRLPGFRFGRNVDVDDVIIAPVDGRDEFEKNSDT